MVVTITGHPFQNRIVPTTPISATGAVDFPRVLSGVFGEGFVTAPTAPLGPIELIRACLSAKGLRPGSNLVSFDPNQRVTPPRR